MGMMPDFPLSADEKIRVEILNNVCDHMVTDLLDRDPPLTYEGFAIRSLPERGFIEPRNEFERGVAAAIGLIRFRVNCICD